MSDPPHQKYNRRWYDGISNMTLAILVSQKLPPEIQVLIAKNLNGVIDDCRKQQKHNLKQAISVGPHHRVLGLYKAGERQRWYDPDPKLHRALNFMGTVPELVLAEFAGRILRVGHYVEQQHELVLRSYERAILSDRVEDILQKDVVNFSETDDGFRLIHDTSLQRPSYPPGRAAGQRKLLP